MRDGGSVLNYYEGNLPVPKVDYDDSSIVCLVFAACLTVPYPHSVVYMLRVYVIVLWQGQCAGCPLVCAGFRNGL